MRVSVIATVRDEADSIETFLHSLFRQTRPPAEIVVVDGGSTDGTLDVLRLRREKSPSLRVLHAPGANISQGRNIAISHATGPIIAVTDAGTVVARDWLERLVHPLEADPTIGVSAGFFDPGGETFFERCLSVVITPQLPEIDPERFLPSSRSVAFRKEWWERVGGYPEWLEHCEDLVFDLELKRAGAAFAFTPEARVAWRARPSLRRFYRQYYLYARGDGHAALWPKRHAVRYGAYATGAALFAAGFALPAAWLALALGVGVHLGRYYRRLWRRPPEGGFGARLAAAALVPAIVVTGDVAKMHGYPRGLIERRRAGSPLALAPEPTQIREVDA